MKLIDHIAARGLSLSAAARELRTGCETLRLQAIGRTLPRRRADFERIARWSDFAVMPNDFFPELVQEALLAEALSAEEGVAAPAPAAARATGHATGRAPGPVSSPDHATACQGSLQDRRSIGQGSHGHHEKGSRDAAG